MAKKSFFEKLTGASWTSEDSSEEKKIKTTKKIYYSSLIVSNFLGIFRIFDNSGKPS